MGQRGTRLTQSRREELRSSGHDPVVSPPTGPKSLQFSGINHIKPASDFYFDSHALQLASDETWRQYANTPVDRIFSNTEVMKVVVATPQKTGTEKWKAHFLQSEKYTYHYQFCWKVLGYRKPLEVFNVDMYRKDERDYVLGTIVYYKDHDFYCFELWPGDNLPADKIIYCVEYVGSKVFFNDKLKWRASSAAQLESIQKCPLPSAAEFLAKRLITNDKLFGGVRYQPLTTGTSFGKLTFVKQEDNLEKIPKDWIVVCDGIPNDLPVVRGLITSQLQTPLCHVALLCSNRLTPNMAFTDAVQDLKKYEGKLVKMSVTSTGWAVEAASKEEEQNWLASRTSNARGGANIKLKSDIDHDSLVDLDSNQATSKKHAIGTKAYQLAKIVGLNLPHNNDTPLKHGFVIPFSAYHAHIVSACASELASVLNTKEDDEQLTAKLAALRTAIETRPIASDFVDEILMRIDSWKSAGIFKQASGAIFRSSTNVEDLPGFNGAGLYLSEPIKKPRCFERKAIEDVIKRVWASVWNTKGFLERQEFGLNQNQVCMAVVVMPFYEAFANGVAITGNPFRADFNAYFINTQVAGKLVTDNCAGETPEQVLIYDDVEPTPELITTSSLAGGQVIIRDEDIPRIWPLFSQLHRHFCKKVDPSSVPEGFRFKPAVDVEFLILDKDTRQFCVLQCRPYTVKYQVDKA